MRLSFLIAAVWLLIAASSGAQTHDHSAMPAAADGEFNPWVISDNRGGFYAAYIRRTAGRSDVMLQHSRNGGAFGSPVRVNNRAGDAAVRNENPPKIALGRSNEVYVVWANEQERWKGDIRFARSLDGGRTFEPAVVVNSGASGAPIGRAFQSIVVDAGGRIFVAWIDERNKTAGVRAAEIWMAVSTDGGRSFSRDRKILSDVCECCRVALAVDSTGAIYLSYRIVPAGGPMFRDIAVARSTDGGQTFRSALVSRDGWELNGCPIAGAAMTIDAKDRIHVVWFTQTGDEPKLYTAASMDHGTSFSKPVLFDSTQKLAKHAHLAVVDNNSVAIAWDDVDNGSLIKWGLFTPADGSLRTFGVQRAASYPVVASSGGRLAVVALQPEKPQVFRLIRTLGVR
jgi:hypothetical protein